MLLVRCHTRSPKRHLLLSLLGCRCAWGRARGCAVHDRVHGVNWANSYAHAHSNWHTERYSYAHSHGESHSHTHAHARPVWLRREPSGMRGARRVRGPTLLVRPRRDRVPVRVPDADAYDLTDTYTNALAYSYDQPHAYTYAEPITYDQPNSHGDVHPFANAHDRPEPLLQ